MKLQTLCATFLLAGVAGCTSAVYHDTDPNRHVVVLEKEPFSVTPQGADEWRAWGGRLSRHEDSEEGQKQLQQQRQAIEVVSGCRIVQERLDEQDARSLRATVDCRGMPAGGFISE